MFDVSIKFDAATTITTDGKARSVDEVFDLVVYALTVSGFSLNTQIMPAVYDLVEKHGKYRLDPI